MLRLIPVGERATKVARERARSWIVVGPAALDQEDTRWVLLDIQEAALAREACRVSRAERTCGVALLGAPTSPRELVGIGHELGTFVFGAAAGTDLVAALDLGWRAPLWEPGYLGFYGEDLDHFRASAGAAMAIVSDVGLHRGITFSEAVPRLVTDPLATGIVCSLHGGPDLSLHDVDEVFGSLAALAPRADLIGQAFLDDWRTTVEMTLTVFLRR